MVIKRTMADNWSPSPFRSIRTALINPLS